MRRMILLGIPQILVLAAFLLPERAGATFVLDSGTPTSSTFPILNNTDWDAAEFSATAGETITQLSTYLTSMTGNGDNFAFDIYYNTANGVNFLGTRNAQLSPDGLIALTATGTYAASGWNSTSVNWVVPTTGDYWLAIQGDAPGTRSLPNFDAQEETSASTGTVPALAFAYDSGISFATGSGVPIGLEVTVAAVPEPATWGSIAAGGLLVLCVWTARRRVISSAS